MNHFNICPSCTYRNNCVLTIQKGKVWSCSEFDEELSNKNITPLSKKYQKKHLELV